jgi:hypothetical protein
MSFDERGIASNIVGIPLTILFLVFSSGSICLLLLLINVEKIIRILRSPLLVGLALLVPAKILAAAGCLSLFEARILDE